MSLILACTMLLSLIRVLRGPTFYDRLVGLQLIGTKTVVLIILFGFIQNRVSLYIDIALAYALIGFVGPLVLAKYGEIGKRIHG